MSAIFSNTLNSQMTHWSQCESRNSRPVLLKVGISSALKPSMLLATNGQDENGLQLGKKNSQRFQVLPLFYAKIVEEFTRNLPLGAL